MKNTVRVLVALLILCLAVPACAEHGPSCGGDHNRELYMQWPVLEVHFGSDGWDWNAGHWQMVSGGDGVIFSGGSPRSSDTVIIFPDKVMDGGTVRAVTSARQMQGGYAGLCEFSDWSTPNARVLVIPDSYTDIRSIGGNEVLDYVSLPACDEIAWSLRNLEDLLWTRRQVTWLVVKGSAAHRALEEQGVTDIRFRGEYCTYAREQNGILVFDGSAFAASIPDMPMADAGAAAANEPPAPENRAILQVPEAELLTAPQLFPFIDGTRWGLADTQGRTVLSPAYDAVGDLGCGVFSVRKGGKYGVVSAWGSVLDCEWDSVRSAGTGVMILQRDGQGAIANLADGMLYDLRDQPMPYTEDGQHIQFAVPDPVLLHEYTYGLYDSHGGVLFPTDKAAFTFYQDGTIGVTLQRGNGSSAMLLSENGQVLKSETENASYYFPTTVPVLVLGDMKNPQAWFIRFSDHTVKVSSPDRLYGVMEGWWTKDNVFMTVREARLAGLTERDALHVSAYIVHRAGDADKVVYCITGNRSGMPASIPGTHQIPLQTVNGCTVLLDKTGQVPFYATAETAGLTDSAESYNRMCGVLNAANGYLTRQGGLKGVTLGPVTREGIGSGELFPNQGDRQFFWFDIHSDFGTDLHVLGETAAAAMSMFEDGSAVVYGRNGKVGLVDDRGTMQLAMHYDRIVNAGDYAVVFIASRADQSRYERAASAFARGDYADTAADEELEAAVWKLEQAKNAGCGICSADGQPDRPIREGNTWLYNKKTGELIPLAADGTADAFPDDVGDAGTVSDIPEPGFTDPVTAGGDAAFPAAAPTAADALAAAPAFGNVCYGPRKSIEVYSGPGTRYYRCANGKASVSAADGFEVAGSDGDWLMIRYTIRQGVRVGYIRIADLSGMLWTGNRLSFANLPAVTNSTAVCYDDPDQQAATEGQLIRNTRVTVLYLSDNIRGVRMAYVETQTDGRPRRTFVEAALLDFE